MPYSLSCYVVGSAGPRTARSHTHYAMGGKLLYLEGDSIPHFSREWSNRWQWWCCICLTIFSLPHETSKTIKHVTPTMLFMCQCNSYITETNKQNMILRSAQPPKQVLIKIEHHKSIKRCQQQKSNQVIKKKSVTYATGCICLSSNATTNKHNLQTPWRWRRHHEELQ